ncbi:MAG: hypothetical protein ACRELA_24465 [Candidatus Rokuibacteriota bacterium]
MARACLTDGRGPGRGDPSGSRWRRVARPALGILLTLGLSACAPTLALDGPNHAGTARFDQSRDTFAFPNLVRAEHPGRRDLFANYCIIMARAANQFFRFARFMPGEPLVPADEYARLTREVMAIAPWDPPRSDQERVVIPGYASLRAFSHDQEAAIKGVFGSNILSMLHWRTWRVALPLPSGHQSRVAGELRRELDAGRPAPLMITNFPDPDLLNHAILVYAYRVQSGVVEFLAYDPNDPGNPLALYFDPATRGFWVEPLPYSPPGRIRAFRIYGSPLL